MEVMYRSVSDSATYNTVCTGWFNNFMSMLKLHHCNYMNELNCRFPKNSQLCEQWKYTIKVCTGQTTFRRDPFVCSKHFVETDLSRKKKKVVLIPSATPSIFPNTESDKVAGVGRWTNFWKFSFFSYENYDVLLDECKENVAGSQKTFVVDVEHFKSRWIRQASKQLL